MNLHILCVLFICSAAVLDGQKEGRPHQRSNPLLCSWKKKPGRSLIMAAIMVDNKIVSSGIFIYIRGILRTILTSANPIERYLKKNGPKNTDFIDPDNRIGVYQLTGGKTCLRLEIASFSANISNRSSTWIRMGFDKYHSPIHDIIFIFLKKKIKRRSNIKNIARSRDRKQDWSNSEQLTFIEITHVYKGNALEIEIETWDGYAEEVDCDEWIPRAWGRFVCIKDVDNKRELLSGTPLVFFVPGTKVTKVIGIACFTLMKGEESILVFTDFSFYRWIAWKHEERLFSTRTP